MTAANPESATSSEAPPAIEASGVSKVFRGAGRPPTIALKHLDFAADSGEFVVLIGPSGCGKSTLLRLLAGLELPSVGQVRQFGEQVSEPTSRASMMFQSAVLLPWRSVLSNVLLPVEILRRESKEFEERAMSLLTMTGLDGFADHYPQELSGGMRQRVAICRSLMLQPELLFMDEPFGALDAITRASMNEQIYDIWRRSETTIVFVTHDISEAVRLGTRILVMSPRPGRIIEEIRSEIESDQFADRVAHPRFHEYVTHLEKTIRHPVESEDVGPLGPGTVVDGDHMDSRSTSTQN